MPTPYVIKPCTKVPMHDIFEAFAIGFSDYVIPLTMDEEAFTKRFFGSEGNTLNTSYIAYANEQPIAVLLGGIRLFDGIKTMRCGTLCVAPLHRKSGIAKQLFDFHKRNAQESNCRQLFLEVIKTNEPAIQFYLKQGYEKTYDLKYYNIDTLRFLNQCAHLSSPTHSIVEINLAHLKQLRKTHEIHINWQSDLPYVEGFFDTINLGIFDNDQLIGAIALTTLGKIIFLWISPDYRHTHLGTLLLVAAAQKANTEKLTTCLPSNCLFENFLRKHHFDKDHIEQYEMYLPL